MVKGFTHQLTNSVRSTGLALFPAATTSAKSIFTMIGYIMRKRQIAIGIETTGAPSTSSVMPSSVRANPGAIRPSAMPATMQRSTHTVSRRSKPCMRRSEFSWSLMAAGRLPDDGA